MLNHSFFQAAALVAFVSTGTGAFGQAVRTDGLFTILDKMPQEVRDGGAWVRPTKYAAVKLDFDKARKHLARTPLEGSLGASRPTSIQLPMPEGTIRTFEIVEAPVMAPELQAQFPLIRTYRGVARDDAKVNLRMDLTPEGFHAQILGPEGMWVCIDPYTRGDITHYASYHAKDVPGVDIGCRVTDDTGVPMEEISEIQGAGTPVVRRTYRVAVAATAEFTAFYGGTAASALSAVVTAMNRTTQIYETELAIRLTLVANNNLLMYTNAASDPYTNDDSIAMLSENQTNLDAVIGSANYDIGHVFATTGGGVASLGVVCNVATKARGVSANFGPFGGGATAPSTTLTVAHEIGHQFNSPHSWNGKGNSCTSSQWGGSNAMEPGGGSTIMSYAGSCTAGDNFTGTRDPFFHAGCLDRINNYAAAAGNCSVQDSPGNQLPTVTIGAPQYVVPANTPLTLVATGVDPDGDTLTYSWEALDNSVQTSLNEFDTGSSPLFRSRAPSGSPRRDIPTVASLIAGTSPGEILPTTTRLIRMRCTVRDGVSGASGVALANTTLRVLGTAGPFEVTFPSTNVVLSGATLIRWNPAGTNVAPISCNNVKILLSTDNGATFPTVLLNSTPNTGSAAVVLPNLSTSNARIRIEGVESPFYNISKSRFTITTGGNANGILFDGTGSFTVNDTTGNGNSNSIIEPGETAVQLTLPIRNMTSGFASSVTGVLTSLTPTVSVSVANSSYGSVSGNSTANNSPLYRISVGPAHPCGAPVQLRLTVTAGGTNSVVDFTIPTGSPTGVGPTVSTSFSGATAIPDGDPVGVDLPVNVAGFGIVGDVRVFIGGTTCSSSASSTTVGLNHDRVGQLAMWLTSPSGTRVPLMHTPGAQSSGGVISSGLFGNAENNFCQLTLTSDLSLAGNSVTPAIQNISGAGPFGGFRLSAGDLREFIGEPGSGTWTLTVADLRSGTTGTIRDWTLQLKPRTGGVCTPPGAGQCNPADIADDQGNAPPVVGIPNTGNNEGDYNAFFNGFFIGASYCDIADDQGNAPPVPGNPNNGVNEGDYNAFFNNFFLPCGG